MKYILIGGLRIDQSFNKRKSNIFDVTKRFDVTVANYVRQPNSTFVPECYTETSRGCRTLAAWTRRLQPWS